MYTRPCIKYSRFFDTANYYCFFSMNIFSEKKKPKNFKCL